MRRSRRKGQLRRTSSMRRRSHSTISVSSLSREASAITCPNGSATNEEPQNSRPLIRRAFEAHAIHRGDENAVGDGVGALDGAPGIELRRAEFRLLRGMPADGRGIEKNIRAAQAREARAFGIPLVPADQHADPAVARVEVGEAQIAGREIKLLVVERIVGDVHLAVEAQQRAIGVEHRRRVVIKAGGAALEERSDDDDAQIRARACRALRWSGRESVRPDRSSRHFLRGRNTANGKAPARQTICAPRSRRLADGLDRAGEICGGIGGAFPL